MRSRRHRPEVLLVVRRRLGDFAGGNLPGWLYRITSVRCAIFAVVPGPDTSSPSGASRNQTSCHTPARILRLRLEKKKKKPTRLYADARQDSQARRSTFILFESKASPARRFHIFRGIPRRRFGLGCTTPARISLALAAIATQSLARPQQRNESSTSTDWEDRT